MENDNELPRYETPGRILVCLWPPDTKYYEYEVDVLDWDQDSCVFWINEGVGFDWWFSHHVALELPESPGYFVLEGIKGYFYTHWGPNGREDDEEWEFAFCRRATPNEIETGLLSNP
jgi:hypothetical protein